MTLKIYAYIRQSSLEQVRFGYNLEEQERQIKEYCRSKYNNDYNLVFYRDAGRTGTNTKRPELQKLLLDSKKNKPDVIVFHNIDRLSRELIDLWSMIKFFSERNIKLDSVIGYIDLSNAYGIGNVLNEGLSAMIESMKISDRTIRALKEGVYQGKYPFPHAPLGYKKIDKRLYLSDNQNELEAVKYIFNAASSNKYNIRYIRRYIRKEYGIVLTDDRINRIIKNRVYTGTMIYKDIIKENYCDSLISSELWELANKNKRIRKITHVKTDYFFKNVCYCSDCNTYMINTSGKSHNKKIYAYYKCPVCKKIASQIKIVNSLYTDLNSLAIKLHNDETGINNLIKELDSVRSKSVLLVNEQENDGIDIETFYRLYRDLENKTIMLEKQIKDLESNRYAPYSLLSTSNKQLITNKYIKMIKISFNNNDFSSILVKKE